jgi:hypothetical protein
VDDVAGRKTFGEAEGDFFLRRGRAGCGGEKRRSKHEAVRTNDHEILLPLLIFSQ